MTSPLILESTYALASSSPRPLRRFSPTSECALGKGMRDLEWVEFRINAYGTVVLALMIRDYLDVMPARALSIASLASATGFLRMGPSSPYQNTSQRRCSVDDDDVYASFAPTPQYQMTQGAMMTPGACQGQRLQIRKLRIRKLIHRNAIRHRFIACLGGAAGQRKEVFLNGITDLAQVLKRNRTLKVMNLAENKIDVAGLGV
ncbi:hypothetical protein C8J56DRAFT_901858 [Mycena floridula]|nr:hypothetical protein C8J56DRAFT_901858 [Mycena floridula]